jgi:hypothetical protein
MVKVKYIGVGLVSRGYEFSPTLNDGLYDIKEEDYKYLNETFPEQFVLIEKKAEKKPAPKAQAKRPAKQKETEAE